jgi:PKD repeat protein
LLYEWDFDGDGTYDLSSASSPLATHAYSQVGTYIAALRATDDDAPAKTDVATVVVEVREANQPPVALDDDCRRLSDQRPAGRR